MSYTGRRCKEEARAEKKQERKKRGASPDCSFLFFCIYFYPPLLFRPRRRCSRPPLVDRLFALLIPLSIILPFCFSPFCSALLPVLLPFHPPAALSLNHSFVRSFVRSFIIPSFLGLSPQPSPLFLVAFVQIRALRPVLSFHLEARVRSLFWPINCIIILYPYPYTQSLAAIPPPAFAILQWGKNHIPSATFRTGA